MAGRPGTAPTKEVPSEKTDILVINGDQIRLVDVSVIEKIFPHVLIVVVAGDVRSALAVVHNETKRNQA